MITHATAARETTAELLGNALHRSRVFSTAGLHERFFTRVFRDLVYAQIWEDPVVDMNALDIGPGQEVIAIASGGCNSLSDLTADLRLKVCALQNLPDYETFFRFFGRADARANVDRQPAHVVAAQIDLPRVQAGSEVQAETTCGLDDRARAPDGARRAIEGC